MATRHAHAGFYTPIDPDTRCNCGECYECRRGQARAKADNVGAELDRAILALNRARTDVILAQAAHAAALERLAEVQP